MGITLRRFVVVAEAGKGIIAAHLGASWGPSYFHFQVVRWRLRERSVRLSKTICHRQPFNVLCLTTLSIGDETKESRRRYSSFCTTLRYFHHELRVPRHEKDSAATNEPIPTNEKKKKDEESAEVKAALEAERLAKEEAERLEQERLAREEEERLERLAVEKEDRERI